MAKQPKLKAAQADDAPEELRTDGPTLAEYRAAGYTGPYPPRGYAVREEAAPEPMEDPEMAPRPKLHNGRRVMGLGARIGLGGR